MNKTKYKIIIPVFNGGELWKECVDSILELNLSVKDIIVIDSDSNDGSLEVSQSAGFTVHQIKKNEFNHGGTRQFAVNMLGSVDVAVFLTQDTILYSDKSIKNLVNIFDDSTIGCAFGRQLPRANANHIEAHARYFNYPKKPYIRSLSDKDKYGIKIAFISNSFAAYKVSTLNDVGGFPDNVIFGEDTYVAAKMLLKNYRLAYVSDAQVYHSHNYSSVDIFKRYFDIGVFHKQNNWLISSFGKPEGEGFRFVRSELYYVMRKKFILLPTVLIRSVCKYLGYRLGSIANILPQRINKILSMNKRYWDTV